MPLRAYLKELWEGKFTTCFSGQAASPGDEPTAAPAGETPVPWHSDVLRNEDVATSHLVSLAASQIPRRTRQQPDTTVHYPDLPLIFIIIVLMTAFVPHTYAQGFGFPRPEITDLIPVRPQPTTRVVSVPDTTTNEGGTQGTDTVQNEEDTVQTEEDYSASDVSEDSGNSGVVKDRDGWNVPGVGHFKKRAVYTFEGGSLPDGLQASNYTVACRSVSGGSSIPYNEIFDPVNVRLSRGFLNLTVPGGQTPTEAQNFAVSGAEVTTVEQNILYASVRTNAIFSKVPGTCHGLLPLLSHGGFQSADNCRLLLLPIRHAGDRHRVLD
jgi:hypothetical protein